MRVIEKLRELFGGKWTYNPKLRVWESGEGWYVYASAWNMGDYDNSPLWGTQYRRSDTGEQVEVACVIPPLVIPE